MKKKTVALMLALNMLMNPAMSLAGTLTIPGFYGKVTLPTVLANQLPQVKLNADGSQAAIGATVGNSVNGQMNIDQNQQNATISWDKFDIGAKATVYFKQQKQVYNEKTKTLEWVAQPTWAALNRIYDLNPSQIFGKLKADGKVYLINQNGILFAPGSQVNVHSLIASTLNLKDADFFNGLLRFRAENYQDPNYDSGSGTAAAANNMTLLPPDAYTAVSNFGNITTDAGGSVFLLGPYVENGGIITAPVGKINLVAVKGAGIGASPDNCEVSIVESSDPGAIDVAFSDKAITGTTVNLASGQLIADSGRIGLYGSVVQQDGLIRAVSAVKRGGEIYLAASDRVVTGTNSLTESPVSNSTEKADQSFAFSGGTISIGGLTTKTDEVSLQVNQPLRQIEHNGAISAPGGKVTLNAVEQVLLGSGSSINVAGLWVDEPASAAMIEVQFNSVQLADAYDQKNGPLKGQNTQINMLNGSSIGNVSGYYTAQEKTARERSIKGGSVTIDGFTGAATDNPLGQLIVKDGAAIDFSGGGVRYSAGTASTTKLLSGNTIYDISSAPQSLSYQKILSSQKVVNKRFGITQEFKGLYLGGGTPLSDYVPARIAGSDAGTFSMAARQVVLDGTLNGSVTRGQYQTQVTSRSATDHQAYDISVARGLEEPSGGTLIIGRDPGGADNKGTSQLLFDSVVEEIAVLPTTIPLGAGDTPTGSRTELSAAILNNAGLSKLELFSNTSVSIESGAKLSLLPGGSFTARARRIVNTGEVHVAGGSAEFMIRDNITSHPFLYDSTTQQLDVVNTRYAQILDSKDSPLLYFAPGSVVSVAGGKVDNSSAAIGASGTIRNGHTSGGQLTIQDFTVDGTSTGNNLVVAGGALLDVSGGYQIDQKGKLKGGDAGTLTLRAMNLTLAGDLRGLALPGQKGGAINLHAGEIVVGKTGSDSPVGGKLLLADNRFQETGFTRIGLTAINNITFESGTDLEPSTARLPSPTPGGAAVSNSYVPAGKGFTSGYLGPTSISAEAGKNIYPGTAGTLLDPDATIDPNQSARVTVASRATVKTAPGGAITMTGPSVEVAGDLQALGGNISLKATVHDLKINGTVDASGYLKPVTDTVAGQPAGPAPQAAGTVSLEATAGSIIMNTGAKVDVSGTAPTERLISGPDGKPVQVTVAGDPGSLNLTYGTGLTLDGEIDAHGRYTGVRGGTLTIKKTLATGDGMTFSEGDMRRYQADGFDALTLQSATSIAFNGPVDFTAGRSFTLDAPLITGTGHDDVTLNAPWIRLVNTSSYLPGTVAAGVGSVSLLTLGGDWIDLEGSTSVTGFGNVLLAARRDMRFTDRIYPDPSKNGNLAWFGEMVTAGNLTLKASRIYPTTASDFTITSHGKVTIKPSGYSDTTPIYSAGGKLTINADQGIEHQTQAVLAAPMGSITLNATGSGQDGRVYLADGSVIKTSGEAPVNYGSFDGTFWTVKDLDTSTKGQAVNGAPDKSISVNGDQVFVMKGAQLDFAGGGSIYSYLYEAGIEGTTNPISIAGTSALTGLNTRGNRYVIMPDNSVQLPGFTDKVSGKVLGAVHLEATTLSNGTRLKEGTYSILPEQFAFLPGALVITDLGSTVGAGGRQITSDGYRIAGGYETFLGTSVKSPVLEAYSIRSAADVLGEGHFTVKQLVAGDAGSMSIKGNTTVMAGTVKAGPLPGYNAGSLTLGGAEIDVQETVTALDDTFGFDSTVPQELEGKLQIAASTLSGFGLGELNLGDAQTTSKLTVKQKSVLDVANINLIANDLVTIESGAQVNAVSQSNGGKVSITVVNNHDNGPGQVKGNGKIDIQTGAKVHASSSVTLNANDVNLQGDLTVAAHGSMNLTSNSIYFVPDSFTKSGNGLYLTEGFWKSFANYDQVTLTSSSDLNFQRDVTMTTGNALTLDAGRFTGQTKVAFNAHKITLQNSGGAAPAPVTGNGNLTLNANEIQAHGNVAFDGFGTVNLTSTNDLTLLGAGSLKSGGDLNMTTARVTTSFYRDANNTYNAADFTIATDGAVNIMNSGGKAGTGVTPGGSLAITGRSITDSGTIEVASGVVKLTATGSGAGDGVNITDRTFNVTDTNGNSKQVTTYGTILAQGSKQATSGTATTGEYDYTPGGRIVLSSANGGINLKSGTVLDVSAREQGDAGAISLSAPTGAVAMNGALLGNASSGYAGGSLTLDTNAPSLDFTALNGKLGDGGFTGRLNIRARQGDLTLDQGKKMTAEEIVLEADGTDGNGSVVYGTGNINVNGTITATDGTNGGRVELYAQNDLTVTGSIKATGAKGGDVYLGSESGMLSQSGVIDVAGTSGSGGSVTLRALRNGSGVNMALPGQINGASQVVAEAFKVYNNNSNYTISTADVTSWMKDASDYIATAAMPAGWSTRYHFRPGIEIQSGGDITLSSNLDLSPNSGLTDRFGSALEAGVLTLRAAGNLNINANLVDHPTTSYTTLHSDTLQPSWGINLVAGADRSGASPFAVNTAKSGDLTISSGHLVYTENAPIRFASANNTNIYSGVASGYMITGSQTVNDSTTANGAGKFSPISYTLANYGGTIRGDVGNDLTINSGTSTTGAIQTATGDIELRVGHDLSLGSSSGFGAIRTTGEYAKGATVETGPGSGVIRPAKITDYWTYQHGGNIRLDVGGAVSGDVSPTAWDYAYGGGTSLKKKNMRVAASFGDDDKSENRSTRGIATMGGGDISVRTGGAFNTQIGAFGTDDLNYSGSGNLTIVAGGDLKGRFRVMDGTASLTSAGNFGASNNKQVLEIADSQLTLSAQGDVHVGAFVNPDNSRDGIFFGSNQGTWNLTYGNDTSVSIASLAGDVTLYGENTFANYNSTTFAARQRILPATFALVASGYVRLLNDFCQAPAPKGNLRLVAGGSIDGGSTSGAIVKDAKIFMTDRDPLSFYGYLTGTPPDLTTDDVSAKVLVHMGDANPIEISAVGDIRNLQLYLTKKAEITAGGDILGMVYSGQNIDAADVSSIRAGRNIHYDYILGTSSTGNVNVNDLGIQQGGPGALVVQAGNDIDLGNSQGIKTTGNFNSPLLGNKGADLIVVAGAKKDLLSTDALMFFDGKDGTADHQDISLDGLRKAGSDYAALTAKGKTTEALKIINEARSKIIRPLFDEAAGDDSGTITMTKSQISTLSDKDAIYIMARGTVNVGQTAFKSAATTQEIGPTETGIFTAGGGPINIYAGGDVNVNESRVMTFLGGDITIWSDQGNLNAGRGSKTTISASPPQQKLVSTNPIQYVTVFSPPAVGSGIRALTFDPDGLEGPLQAPPPGDIYLFAPKGVIDAGEAGIAGGRLIVGATQILNAQNMVFTAGSVGVPTSNTGVSLGALTGAGSVAETGKMLAESSALGGAKDSLAQSNVVDQFLSKFLDVKVIDFDTDEGNADNDKQDKEKKKKK